MSGLHGPMRIAAAREHERSSQIARLAVITQVVRFTGVGSYNLTGEDALYFGALVLEPPGFAYGVVAPNGLGAPLPLVSVAVTSWLVNELGLYHGAELALRVYEPESEDSGSVVLDIHLQFTGTALRMTLPTEEVPGES